MAFAPVKPPPLCNLYVTLLQRLGVTVLCQAPTEYRMLAKLENLGAAHLPRLRHAVSAGEPLNPEVIARFQDALGLTVHDGYGQTENSLLVANPPGAPLRPGSMGMPTPGHDVAVIDLSKREVRVLTDGLGSNKQPTFAPNGRHIAFVTTRWGREQIAIIDYPTGGKSIRRVTDAGNKTYPDWSPVPGGSPTNRTTRVPQ